MKNYEPLDRLHLDAHIEYFPKPMLQTTLAPK